MTAEDRGYPTAAEVARSALIAIEEEINGRSNTKILRRVLRDPELLTLLEDVAGRESGGLTAAETLEGN